MISIVSIADGVLRARAAQVLHSPQGWVIPRTSTPYPSSEYALVDADSSAYPLGGARWTDAGVWEPYPAPVTPDTRGPAAYNALVLRRAKAREAAGDLLGALNIRSKLTGG